MRLDKYLQTTGIIERRTLANEACKRGLVKVNGIEAKPTREILVDDLIEIFLAKREISVKVLQEIKGNSLKKTSRPEYFEIIKDEAKSHESQFDEFWKNNLDDE